MLGQASPVFFCLQWSKSLDVMSNGKKTCAAMRSCAQNQPKSLSRGTRNHVFTDHENKHYSVGAQLGRAEKGVQSGLYKMKHGFPNHHWNCQARSVRPLLRRYCGPRYSTKVLL